MSVNIGAEALRDLDAGANAAKTLERDADGIFPVALGIGAVGVAGAVYTALTRHNKLAAAFAGVAAGSTAVALAAFADSISARNDHAVYDAAHQLGNLLASSNRRATTLR
jgi:hypothetical protein